MSRSTRIALMCLVLGKVGILSAAIYEDVEVHSPFRQAQLRFEEAYARGDLASMKRAVADQKKAQAASLFASREQLVEVHQ